MKKEIYLIGYGINFYEQRSNMVDYYLEKTDKIFAIEPDITHIEEYLSLDKQIHNLFYLYMQGNNRVDTYNKISEYVINALDIHSSVALLVEGTPFFSDTISEIIEARSFNLGITLNVIDGVSSFDTIIQQLRVPMFDVSLTSYIADDFCKKQPLIDNSTILFLFQPGNVDSSNITIEEVEKSSIKYLKNSLLNYYSPQDKWFLINLGNSPKNQTQIIWNTLENIEDFVNYMHSGTLIVSKEWWPSVLKDTEPTEIEGVVL